MPQVYNNHGGPLSPSVPDTASRPGRAFLPGLLWLAVLFLALAPQAWVQWGTRGIIGLDGYYHIRYAQLLRLAGPRLAIPFPWLPTTILNQNDFTDHHLLFHLALIPFTFGDLIVGAKVAAVLFAAAAFLVWYLIARAEGVRRPVVWMLVLLTASTGFLYRMSMTRRQSLTLLLMLLAVHLVLTRRLKWLVAVGFAFVWTYDGWPVLMAVVGLACLGRWLERRRIDPLPALAPFLGVVLGTVVNPFFPNTVLFPIRHLLPKLSLSSSYSLQVGSEWYPYSFDALIKTSWPAVVMPLLGLALTGWLLWRERGRVRAELIAWGGCALLFLALFLNAKRFSEYEPAFATMFAALAWSAVVATPRARGVLEEVREVLGRRWYQGLEILVVVLLAWRAFVTIASARNDAADTDPPGKYAAAATWLAQNTLPGERVFATDWDDFPRLYYYDTNNAYLVGLDPTYMYQYDPDLYLRWRSITRGQVALPAQDIRERYGCRWVFTDTQHTTFLQQARADARMKQVYADRDAVIFFVSPS